VTRRRSGDVRRHEDEVDAFERANDLALTFPDGRQLGLADLDDALQESRSGSTIDRRSFWARSQPVR
jgi:hypothetical protein